jgi:hypothetical protein
MTPGMTPGRMSPSALASPAGMSPFSSDVTFTPMVRTLLGVQSPPVTGTGLPEFVGFTDTHSDAMPSCPAQAAMSPGQSPGFAPFSPFNPQSPFNPTSPVRCTVSATMRIPTWHNYMHLGQGRPCMQCLSAQWWFSEWVFVNCCCRGTAPPRQGESHLDHMVVVLMSGYR